MAKKKGPASSRHAQRKERKATQRTQNAQLSGAGAAGSGDRTFTQAATFGSTNPYFQNNYFQRWQQWVLWYYTSWEAQKIINIPVDDALREPFTLKGMEDGDAALVMAAYDDLNGHDRLWRALVQERLLGGAAMLMGVRQTEGTEPDQQLKYRDIDKGDLRFINTISVDRISRATYDPDPFSATYDHPIGYRISGIETHISRLLVFDGTPLFSRDSATILQGYRINPAGFGESKLAALYDTLIRMTGTQQGAYQLVNMASVILAKYDNLMEFNGNAQETLTEVVNQISIYRAALLKGKDLEITQHSATFGSVPELVMTFAQLLCGGADVPASRFLGQAPGGLSTDDRAGLENYYNMIAAYQKGHIKPQLIKFFDVLCPSVLGREKWAQIKAKFDIEFAPLWSLNEKEQADVDKSYADIIQGLYGDGMLSLEQALNELTHRDIFRTKIEAEEFLRQPVEPPGGDPLKELGKMQEAA